MDIGASTILMPATLRKILASALPLCSVEVTDSDFSAPPADVVVAITRNRSEFPMSIDVVVSLVDGVSPQRWLLELSRRISVAASCRTICDGTGFGDDPSPYWSIVWDNGMAHLADDVDSVIADGDGRPVRLIRRLDLELTEFASSGLCAVVHRTSRGVP